MEGRCTAGADAHFQGFLEIALGRFETGQEPSDHAVSGTDGVDQRAFRGLAAVYLAVFAEEQGAVTAERYEDVAGPHGLELFSADDDFFIRMEVDAEQFS